ncbi:MAG: protease modulator HflC [Elusimicrobiota bacterium]
MSKITKFFLGIILAALALGILAGMFGVVIIVPETHSAVVTRFGDVKHAIVTGYYKAPETREEAKVPDNFTRFDQIDYMQERYGSRGEHSDIKLSVGAGIYFKLPRPIEKVHTFDSRILDWDGQRNEMATKDLRTLLLDSSSRWKILDPVKFYESVGTTELHAQGRLDEVIMKELEDMITVSLLIETVRNKNLTLEAEVQELMKSDEEDVSIEEDLENMDELRYGRMHVIEQVQKKAAETLKNRFGIWLMDVMITELNYTEEVQEGVFKRMTAERQRIANRYRAEGEETKQKILGEVEEEKRKILGDARGQEIQIVGNAHSSDKDFYRFYRSLESYDESFDEKLTLILSDENKLLQFITDYQ